MKQQLLDQLKELKQFYKQNGFIIVGVFGSYARGQETISSDLDLVYEIQPKFIEKFGWASINKIEEIKQEIQQKLHITKIDLAPKDSMNQTLQDVLKKEMIYV